MNPQFFAYLVISSMFHTLPKDTQQFILSAMSEPSETASNGGTISSQGMASEVVSMEAPAPVPTAPRLPRSKYTPVRENSKPKKDKQKRPMPVCESLRKHSTTQAQKKDKQLVKGKEKFIDLEAKEGTKDIDAKGIEPISKLTEYIPSRKGKFFRSL